MRVNGSFTVWMGVLIIWLTSFVSGLECYAAILTHEWLSAVWHGCSAFGAAIIGWRVARTEG